MVSAAKRTTLGRDDESRRGKYEKIMKYRKFLLHYVNECGILSYRNLKREETTDMNVFAQALPDDLDDMIFLGETWTHSER